MAIEEAEFANEKELQVWVEANVTSFLPNALFIRGFQITTASGKAGIPDGFAFDFEERAWHVIECELLSHGVWPHIAEQITRFVVALQSFESRRKIRDRLFDHLEKANLINSTCKSLGVTPQRLLRELETFIEGVAPSVAIFIDETNQDLIEMAEALDTTTSIYRVRKFLVHGSAEYHSPDRYIPAIETAAEDGGKASESTFDILSQLGGGQLEAAIHRFKCFKLRDGSIVTVKRSKYYPDSGYYWFGVNSSTLRHITDCHVTHVVFVLADDGFVKVPLGVLQEYLQTTKSTNTPDGGVRHFHCLISPPPKPSLFWSNETPRFDLSEYFHEFD